MKKIYILIIALFPTLAFAGGICPPDMTVYADGYNCTATVVLPDVPWGGSCSYPSNCSVSIPGQNVSYNGTHWVAYDLPPGNYTVYYSAYNQCPPNYHCTMNLRVLGGGNVSAVCDQNTVVAIGHNGVGRVYAETFNDYSNSSCGDIADIKVRRVYQGWCPPGVKDDTHFGPYVEFCCDDIAKSPIKVILKVTDTNGNTNECTALVHVQDNIPPTIYCLPDITVNCDYPIDFNNLDQFGTIRPHQNHCGPIYVGGEFCGYDGYVIDNCDVHITETYCYEINECGIGWIQRTFTATDPSGNTARCSQFIYIKDRNPFNKHNIHWPKNITVNECNPADLSPEVTGKPTFDDKPCSMLAATYSDLEFIFNDNDACMKILREWKVLDCCHYNRYTGAGYYTYIQTIKVNDGVPPVFLDCSDIDICTDNVQGCKGYVKLYPQVEDCTPQEKIKWTVWIDYDNNGTVDKVVHEGDISGYIPFGTHKITWEANDGCNNKSTCTKLVTVRDCAQPTPVCYASIATVVVDSVSGTVLVNAKVHDAGSFDNCTSNEDLAFSFSTDPTDNIKAFTCDDLGVNEIPIYVTDEAGNQSRCYVRLEIQDNNNVCLDSLTVHLAGAVRTEEGEGVSNVYFSVIHPDFGEHLIKSDENGKFSYSSFTDLSGFESVMITPLRVDNPINGVSSFDLFLMHKINLGDMEFDSPYQMIAADVNNDGKFSSIDLVELKQLILGQINDFQSNLSWRFVDDLTVIDEDDPLSYTETQFVNLPEFNSRFIGIKIGDMNLDANPSNKPDTRSAESVAFNIEDQYVRAGETVDFIVVIPDNYPVSFQLFMENEKYCSINTLLVNDEQNNSFINKDYAGIVYYGGAENEVSHIHMELTPAINGYLSDILNLSQRRPSIMTDQNYEDRFIDLRFNSQLKDNDLKISVVPNPVAQYTRIHISSFQKQDVELKLYSVTGQMVTHKEISLTEGGNIVNLDTELQDLTSGIYYLIVSSEKTVVRKTLVKM